ncbi:MAG: ribose 5-phosphate isomerase B [Bacteroidales bacterium]|nr:ribose 5-phosphate isomerase B [Bacteroidales bacterium]
MKTIGVCSDHAGYAYKTKMVSFLKKEGYEVKDYGTFSEESCDYPDYAHALAGAVESGEVERGVAFCGTGEGMAMTLNKHAGVRAGLCWKKEIAELTRRHNDANVLVMPARFISWRMVCAITRVWFGTAFEGGRHQRRVEKIAQ